MTLNLTDRQAGFVAVYVSGPTMGNASASAVASGYSAESAPDLMSSPAVMKAIADAKASACAHAAIGQARTLAELTRIGLADIRAVVQWSTVIVETGEVDDDGVPVTRQESRMSLTDWALLNPDAAATIAEIRQTKDGLVVKMHSKIAALIEIGKHLGVATKIAHIVPTGYGPVETITHEMTAIEAADLYRLTLDEG